MLSKTDNEFLTRSGKGTPMGELLRRFWQPALLSAELPERDGPPKKIRILGEDLLAFRDTGGNVGIVEPPDDMNLANAPSNKELLLEACRNRMACRKPLPRQ